ncbi:MAG TPA: preprotein translocase subunit SecG [Chitinophagaceae bacterium]|nr:preprotein translocase subunit SecG [Chitinophagaceae bacterium]
MTILYLVLIIIASVILGLVVLIQNPKGGGLAGNIAGFSTQFMGVKQTTDVLEKGTWLFAGVIGALCLLSSFFISRTASANQDNLNKVGGVTVPGNNQPQQTNPNNTIQFPTKPDSNK